MVDVDEIINRGIIDEKKSKLTTLLFYRILKENQTHEVSAIIFVETLKIVKSFENMDLERDLEDLFHDYVEKYKATTHENENKAYKQIIYALLDLAKTKEIKINKKERTKRKEKIVKILQPEKVEHGLASINITGNIISLSYKYDRDFMSIMKEYQYSWNKYAKVWYKESDDTLNNAAEIINALLINGFRVEVKNKEVITLVEKGVFQKENLNKIDFKKNLFTIRWKGRNDGLYWESRELPTAFWSKKQKAVVVKDIAANEIIDFAKVNGFEFTDAAKAKLENLRIKKKLIHPVTKHELDKRELEHILNSSTEILEDLKED